MRKYFKYLVLAVLPALLCLSVTAASLGTIVLSEQPFTTQVNTDGTETVFHDLPVNPAWNTTIDGVGSTGLVFTNPFYIDTDGPDEGYDLYGSAYPVGSYIDVSDLIADGIVNFDYELSYSISSPSENDDNGAYFTCTVTPRYVLLSSSLENLGSIAGQTFTDSFDANAEAPDAFYVSHSVQQSIQKVSSAVKYISLEWALEVYITSTSPSYGAYMEIQPDSITMWYLKEHVLTDSELAEKLNSEVGKIAGELGAAGDAFAKVPQPDIDDVIKPIDEIVDPVAVGMVGDVFNTIVGWTVLDSFFLVLGMLLLFSYVLFGKKG